MYDRDYEGRTLSFEASGGLVNGSLILQDKQTDTYWSIMTGEAETGALAGERLRELPVGEKMMWRDWRARHPDTLVLSVNGIQDPKNSPYDVYFRDPRGYRGMEAHDQRLETKTPVFAFLEDDRAHAVEHRAAVNGRRFKFSNETAVFLYRGRGDEMFRGTAAFRSDTGFEKRDGVWVELSTGARFDPDQREFVGGEVQRLNGFDTFWYNWSLAHRNVKLLR